MDSLILIAGLIGIIALVPLLCVFGVYPCLLYFIRSKHLSPCNENKELPSVTMLIAARNGEKLVPDKIKNCLSLNYPKDKLNFIFFSDGSTDNTLSLLNSLRTDAITVLFDKDHIGKAQALNRAAENTQADILVFSDLDALLVPEAISYLVKHFANNKVSGVCGQRTIASDTSALKDAQKKYIRLDSWIKQQESQLGYLTSNDGKLYAIRRVHHTPIAEGVTDDLYSALAIISRGKQFVFEGQARAFIKTPSRNSQHEISRRRRITCRSLTGIAMFPALLNPFKSGRFAFGLLINKVMRRLIPLSLILIFLSNMLLFPVHLVFKLSLLLQVGFYFIALTAPFLTKLPKKLAKLVNAVHYFVLGNLGVLLGMIDFIRNKRVIKWEPIKND
ncbi:glycosyltransferase [Pseudoalteromonas sp.]|uniref:glycosyltransferase n=1 Tax=Pseudoalteromonas sp. TaxID=53249 RepID=UPI00356A5570